MVKLAFHVQAADRRYFLDGDVEVQFGVANRILDSRQFVGDVRVELGARLRIQLHGRYEVLATSVDVEVHASLMQIRHDLNDGVARLSVDVFLDKGEAVAQLTSQDCLLRDLHTLA